MLKKALSAILAIGICIALAVPAFAEAGQFVTVSSSVFLDDKSIGELNRTALNIEKKYGFRFLCNITEDMGTYTSAADYAENLWKNEPEGTEGGIFVYSARGDDEYFYFTEKTEAIFKKEILTSVYASYALGSSYYDGVKGIYDYIGKVLEANAAGSQMPTVPADSLPDGMVISVPEKTDEEKSSPILTDRAKVITDGKKRSELITLLRETSEKSRCQFSVMTVDSVDGASLQENADKIFANGSFGYGDGKSGVLLLMRCGEKTECAVACGGKAKAVFTKPVRSLALKKVGSALDADGCQTAAVKFANSFSFIYRFFLLFVLAAVVIIAVIVLVIILAAKKAKKKKTEGNSEEAPETIPEAIPEKTE